MPEKLTREVSVETEYRYFVGVDGGWSDHKVAILDADGRLLEERVVEHDGGQLARFVDRLTELCNGSPQTVSVAIEVNRGAVVEALLERGFHVYAINPKLLDRFRDRFSVAGAKDDRRDALVLGSSLRTDRHSFRLLSCDDPQIVQLRSLVRIDVELRGEVVRLANQLTEQLHRFFPQFLEFGSVATQPWLWELMELIPTPEKAKRVRPTSIAALLKRCRISRVSARKVCKILRKQPFALAPGAIEAASSHVAYLLPRLKLAYEQRADCEQRMTALVNELATTAPESSQGDKGEHRDARILLSLPGVGTRVAATMLAEAGRPLSERDYTVLRAYGGVAPVTRQSGKRSAVTMRRACNSRVREMFYHWARVAVQHDAHCKGRYERLREKGHSYARALRSVADSMLKVLCAMLRSGTLYDPTLRSVGEEAKSA